MGVRVRLRRPGGAHRLAARLAECCQKMWRSPTRRPQIRWGVTRGSVSVLVKRASEGGVGLAQVSTPSASRPGLAIGAEQGFAPLGARTLGPPRSEDGRRPGLKVSLAVQGASGDVSMSVSHIVDLAVCGVQRIDPV